MIKHVSNKIQNAIQMELFKAKESIKIAVAWFTNELLLQPLILKLQNGVSVELILNDDEINRGGESSLDFTEFLQAGGILRWNNSKQLMHDKFCIIDDRIVITGSYNWTNKAEYNEESVTISVGEQGTIDFYLNKFNNLSKKYVAELGKKQGVSNESFEIRIISRETFVNYNLLPITKVSYDIIEQDGKKGLCLADGTFVLDVKYQDIYKIGEFLCVKRFFKDSQLFDPLKDYFVGPTFENIKFGDYSDRGGLLNKGYPDYFFERKGKVGCLDLNGNSIIDCLYDKIEHIGKKVWSYTMHFRYSYRVERNGLVGILSEKGALIIPCEYENIMPLWDGSGYCPLFYIVKKGKLSLFDAKTGKQRTDFIYDDFKVLTYDSANIWACREGKYALMSQKGEVLTDYVYNEEIHDKTNPKLQDEIDASGQHILTLENILRGIIYIVKNDNGFGALSPNGEILIECKYKTKEEIEAFYPDYY